MGSQPRTVSMITSLLLSASLSLLSLLPPPAGAQYASCPEPYGLQVYPHDQYCDKFYKCANGTLTEETCENGLVFDGYGAIHNHCNYNWAVDCGKRVYDDTPISSPGCLYQFGLYPVERAVRPLSSSAPMVWPTRRRATRAWPTLRRSTSATTRT